MPRNAPPPVVLLGDFHVEGNPAREIGGFPVINMGIEEDRLDDPCGGMLKRLHLLPMAHPAHVVIQTGLNDICENKDPVSIESCLRQVVAEIRKLVPQSTIHIASLPPTRDKYSRYMRNIAITNAILEEFAESHHLSFVDLFSLLEDDDGNLAQNYTSDGGHLNETGYEAVNEMLEKHLKEGVAY
jgi:lysophospholipase L1-like esterase